MDAKTVLIADDDSALVNAISLRLKQYGLETLRSPDATHALYGAQRMRPDLIIMDISMPGGNGMAVCEMLASDPVLSKIPIIVHTGSSDVATKKRCKELGVHYIFKSPGAMTELKELVFTLLDVLPTVTTAPNIPISEPPAEEPTAPSEFSSQNVKPSLDSDSDRMVPHILPPDRPAPPPLVPDEPSPTSLEKVVLSSDKREKQAEQPPVEERTQPIVLVIDDDADISKTIMVRLAPYGIDVRRAFDGMQGFWTALDVRPDAIILDMQMPDGGGDYVIGRFKSHSLLANIPTIILTGAANPAVERKMMGMGANGYLKKPLVFQELLDTLGRYLDFPKSPTAPLTNVSKT